jgi:hypothetical protein
LKLFGADSLARIPARDKAGGVGFTLLIFPRSIVRHKANGHVRVIDRDNMIIPFHVWTVIGINPQ